MKPSSPPPVTADLFQQLEPVVLQDLYHYAPVGYHSLDADGRFLLINETELRWLGYSREEVIGRRFFSELLAPDQRAFFTEQFELFKKTGVVKDLRFTLERQDGSHFPILLNDTAIYDEDGRFLMTRTVVLDLTVQQALEDQIFQKNEELNSLNEQLFALNQTKNRFIGVVAHDLQNPITNLRMLAAKFRKTAETLTTRQAQWVEEMDETARHMGELIQQTLDVNRIERNANAPQFADVDVLPLLAELLNRFTYLAERKAIRLRLLSEQSEGRAFTDPAYLTEIVENLISNAIKFSPGGKTVRLTVHSDAHALQIDVADEGPGIPADEQTRLFGRFTVLSPRPTAGESSSGLGLSIAKEYADQLGASLHYEGRPNAGATFILRLPIRPR
ncbi:PAS domain-containing sensor histidine kinase [Larkinella rosea]|uniref:histidine kinase n=1 Tax=Larkinella rosea TaxID=2025312 RepID=A0A3P1BUL8_9BACT|nr:PAS domain-containing sensor histidine kinase [Larkinella rosea]RRB04805.1 PAS domain-containing sensor histidine kinase [Larkinella rosea]